MKSNIIGSFKNKRILLVGDSILDIYIYGNIVGQALYAAVPEVEEIKSLISFGGNGLVASNILKLGGNLTFFSVIGADEDAKYYDSFVHPQLKKFFFVDKTRKTTVKRRWYAGGKALLQVNKVDNHNIGLDLEKKIIKSIDYQVKNADIIVIMDPQHGLMTKNLINCLKKMSKKYKKPMYVDVQISHRKSNHHLYKGVDTMFLNQNEAIAVYSKFNLTTPQKFLAAIKKKLKLNNVIVKLGNQGSIALLNTKYIRTKPYKVKPVDVCGAGDAFLAAFSLGDRNWPEESLKIANIWGALSTTIHGTMPPSLTDLKNL